MEGCFRFIAFAYNANSFDIAIISFAFLDGLTKVIFKFLSNCCFNLSACDQDRSY